uniref:Uncharacterized protein n=1 Tax=Megaselia scalaris TaxID=36166 RepID=T1GG75_MEGSC
MGLLRKRHLFAAIVILAITNGSHAQFWKETPRDSGAIQLQSEHIAPTNQYINQYTNNFELIDANYVRRGQNCSTGTVCPP